MLAWRNYMVLPRLRSMLWEIVTRHGGYCLRSMLWKIVARHSGYGAVPS